MVVAFCVPLLLPLVVTAILLASGYAWAAAAEPESAAARVTLALPTGLMALLFSVAVVNTWIPLTRTTAVLVLLPWLAMLGAGGRWRRLAADLGAVGRDVRCWAAVAGVCGLLVALLWPLVANRDVTFYDGSSNHDAFLWIAGAEHLQHANYLTRAVFDAAHPFFAHANAIVGTAPAWGRMGAEGYLAVVASLAGLPVLEVYLAATAALIAVWVALQFLVLRAFWATPRGVAGTLAVVCLQPVFIFFHANANAPNLFGVLAATTAIVALDRLARHGGGAAAALTAFSIHGVVCTYPEMLPVALIPCVALIARLPASDRRKALLGGCAVIAGFVVDPLSTVRAWHGFWSSLALASADLQANRFGVFGASRLPALTFLSVPLGHDLNALLGVLASATLLVAAALAWRRAGNRTVVGAAYAGIAIVAVYTGWSGFGYGWQKTAQFSGLVLATLFPGAALAAAAPFRGRTTQRRGRFAVAIVTAGLAAYATVANLREVYKWSGRKYLTRDWNRAADYLRHHEPTTILAVRPSTPWPFFYTMWASYYFRDTPLSYRGGPEVGGYLATTRPPEPSERALPAGALELVIDPRPGVVPLWRSGRVALARDPRSLPTQSVAP